MREPETSQQANRVEKGQDTSKMLDRLEQNSNLSNCTQHVELNILKHRIDRDMLIRMSDTAKESCSQEYEKEMTSEDLNVETPPIRKEQAICTNHQSQASYCQSSESSSSSSQSCASSSSSSSQSSSILQEEFYQQQQALNQLNRVSLPSFDQKQSLSMGQQNLELLKFDLSSKSQKKPCYKFTKCSTNYKVQYRDKEDLDINIKMLDRLMYQNRKWVYCQNQWVIQAHQRQYQQQEANSNNKKGVQIDQSVLDLFSHITQTKISTLLIQKQPFSQPIFNFLQLVEQNNTKQKGNETKSKEFPYHSQTTDKLFKHLSAISFPNLQHLSLRSNRLTSLQHVYECLNFILFKQMKQIDLSENYFTSLRGFCVKGRLIVSGSLSLKSNKFNNCQFSRYFSRLDLFTYLNKRKIKQTISGLYDCRNQLFMLQRLQIDENSRFFEENSSESSDNQASNRSNSIHSNNSPNNRMEQLQENIPTHRMTSQPEQSDQSQSSQSASNQSQDPDGLYSQRHLIDKLNQNIPDNDTVSMEESENMTSQFQKFHVQCHDYTFLLKLQSQSLESLQYDESHRPLFTFESKIQNKVREKYTELWL